MCNHYSAFRGIPEWAEEHIPGIRISDNPLLPGLEIQMYPKRLGAVITQSGDEKALQVMSWGIVPHFGVARPVTNARQDKLLKGAMWKKPARERRCLVPASGYFEPGPGPAGARGEVLFRVADRDVFCFAGLWDIAKDGRPAFTIVTTAPNETAAIYHDRMPVVLSDSQAFEWLGDQPLPDDTLMSLCKGLSSDGLLHEVIPAKPRELKTLKKPEADTLDLFG